MTNLHYTSSELSGYYANNRIGWNALYLSEQTILDALQLAPECRALDLGCACGGLGVALSERYGITSYTGVDISTACIDGAPRVCPHGLFLAGDFLDVHDELGADFDLACSLSAADWNVKTEELLSALAGHLKPGGHLFFTCRVSNELSSDEMVEAKQEIVFGKVADGEVEIAPYKVYSLPRALRLLTDACPARRIIGYGYWGDVPTTVEGLPWDRVFYLVLAVEKAAADYTEAPRLELDVALDLITHGTNAGN